MTEIKSNIKNPVYLNLDITASKSKATRNQSGCCIFDVNLASGTSHNISTISFKNYFTAYVTLKFQSINKNCKWKVALESYKLMIDPHSTMNAEDQFEFVIKDFKEPLNEVTVLRFVLQQPSCLWKEFSIRNLCINSAENNSTTTSALKNVNIITDIKKKTDNFHKSHVSSSHEALNDIPGESVDIGISHHGGQDLLRKMKEMSCLPIFQQRFLPSETYTGNHEKEGSYDATGLIHPL